MKDAPHRLKSANVSHSKVIFLLFEEIHPYLLLNAAAKSTPCMPADAAAASIKIVSESQATGRSCGIGRIHILADPDLELLFLEEHVAATEHHPRPRT